jgi:hypothetical protein
LKTDTEVWQYNILIDGLIWYIYIYIPYAGAAELWLHINGKSHGENVNNPSVVKFGS